jgi:hypothetical protein
MRIRTSFSGLLIALCLTGCAGLGAFIVNSLTALQNAPTVQKRISGKSFFELSKKDSKDTFFEAPGAPGFLCVVHNPGCGIVGNDGHDWFFVPAKQLPLLTQVIGVQFTAISPHGLPVTDPGGLGGQGSYGAKLVGGPQDGSQPLEIAWNNSCAGQYGAVDVWYRISFIVSTKQGVDLEDAAVDPGTTSTPPACAPADFIAAQTPPPPVVQLSGWEGVITACNPFNTPLSRTFTLKATRQPTSPNPASGTTMDETSTVNFPAGGLGSAPVRASFRTQQIYSPGTWTVTMAQVNALTGVLSLPAAVLPGVLGSPSFDFSNNGSCRAQ